MEGWEAAVNRRTYRPNCTLMLPLWDVNTPRLAIILSIDIAIIRQDSLLGKKFDFLQSIP